MSQMLFCSQCGAKLNQDAKFCYACGAKAEAQEAEMIQKEVANGDRASQKLYNQYYDIICDKTIAAYCNQTTLVIDILYQNGVSYGYTNEMVDKVIGEQNGKIERFIKFLENLYIDASLLVPDCSWRKENECIEFGTNLGFYEEDAQAIYSRFIEQNKIRDKFLVILGQIFSYNRKGEISDFDMVPANADMDDCKFYSRFTNAVSQLEQFQNSLHEKSNSSKLSENDMQKLHKKAAELGFYDILGDEDSEDINIIDMLIKGTEIKLGYAIKENEKMFSSIIPFQTVHVLGEDICFESSYFLDAYVEKTFLDAISDKKNILTDILKEQSKKLDNPEVSTLIANCGKLLRSMWESGFSSVDQCQ